MSAQSQVSVTYDIRLFYITLGTQFIEVGIETSNIKVKYAQIVRTFIYHMFIIMIMIMITRVSTLHDTFAS